MVFDKYEQLSEDAQRLLCFYVDMGYGSNKRMDEHIYLLGRYCFTAFDGNGGKGLVCECATIWGECG